MVASRAKYTTPILLIVFLLILVQIPSLVSPYWVRIFAMAFMFAILGQAINLIAGFTGYPAFGNVVFFGLGSYAVAIMLVRSEAGFVAALAVAAAVCSVTALLVGPFILRLKGHYFAIATVGLNEAVRAVVDNLAPLTGGGMGMTLPLPPGSPAEVGRFFYMMLLSVMVCSVAIAHWFKKSRFGHACRAIRDDEVKAAAMGIPTTLVKTVAWAASAALTGLAGGIYAYWFSYIDPASVFDMLIGTKAFMIFLIGGAGTVLGAVFAAFAIELASTFVWVHLLNFHLGALGVGVMLTALFCPKGIFPALAVLWRYVRPGGRFASDRSHPPMKARPSAGFESSDALRSASATRPETST